MQVKEQLKAFQNMQPSNPQFEPTLKALMEDLTQHIKEEESEDLPKLEESLTTEESEASRTFSKSSSVNLVIGQGHPPLPPSRNSYTA
ncbi:hypothetical protein N7486_010044 [Penicillium sp. IBT 16267x]|nr:hypothetical protein N7486_010044 [Penicillium sp. IBT 16267x]